VSIRTGRADGLAALLVVLAAIAFQLPVYDRTMSLLDEGHILQFADIVHRGGDLYRDASGLALPGAFYLLAFAFDLFGPSIAVARWILVFEFAAFAAIVHLMLRQMATPRIAWAGLAALFLYKIWAFPHWQMYSYSTTAQCLLAGATLLVIRYCRSAHPTLLSAAGLVTGLAIFCKQDYGAAGLVAMNAALLLVTLSDPRAERPRPRTVLLLFNGPVVAIGILTAIHFLHQGLLQEMLQQTLVNHFIGISTGIYSSLPPIFPLFEQTPIFRSPYGYTTYVPSILFTVDWELLTSSAFYRNTFLWDLCLKLFFYAPYGVAIFGAIRAWRRRSALRDPARRAVYLQQTTLLIAACASILALSRPVDYVHVAVLYWPFPLLLLLWFNERSQRSARAARVALILGLVPALAIAGYSGRLMWQLHEKFETPLPTPRSGVRVTGDEAAVIGSVVDYVRTHTESDERVAVLPYFTLVSFLAGRDAPHREMYTLWPIEYDPNRQTEVIEALESNSADIAIYHDTQFAQLPRMREFAPEVFRYLVDHWEIDRLFVSPGLGYAFAGLRRSGEPALANSLYREGDRPRLYVEDPRRGSRAIPEEMRAAYLRSELWPFRRVLALRPSCGARRSVFVLAAEVPPGGRLRTAIGFHAQRWFQYPPSWVSYSIRAVDDGERSELFERRLDPHRDVRDRGWIEVDLDLDHFAGRRIDLEFTTRCETAASRDAAMGGFELPRLVTP